MFCFFGIVIALAKQSQTLRFEIDVQQLSFEWHLYNAVVCLHILQLCFVKTEIVFSGIPISSAHVRSFLAPLIFVVYVCYVSI